LDIQQDSEFATG